MGHVRVNIKLARPERWREAEPVGEALVDTGASFTTVPRALAERLGLEGFFSQTVRTAAGPMTVDVSAAYLEYDGRRAVTPVWISDGYSGVLIGVLTLEALALKVAPSSGRLEETEYLLL